MPRGSRSVCSRAVEKDGSSHHDTTLPPIQHAPPTQAALYIQPTLAAQAKHVVFAFGANRQSGPGGPSACHW